MRDRDREYRDRDYRDDRDTDELSLEERMRNIKRDLNAKYRDQDRESEFDDERGREERGNRGGNSKRRLDSG